MFHLYNSFYSRTTAMLFNLVCTGSPGRMYRCLIGIPIAGIRHYLNALVKPLTSSAEQNLRDDEGKFVPETPRLAPADQIGSFSFNLISHHCVKLNPQLPAETLPCQKWHHSAELRCNIASITSSQKSVKNGTSQTARFTECCLP